MLTQHACDGQLRDLRLVVFQDFFKHVLIVLAERRCCATNFSRRAREFRARSLDGELAERRVIHLDEVSASNQLRIAITLGAVLYLLSAHAARLKNPFRLASVQRFAPPRDRRIARAAMLASLRRVTVPPRPTQIVAAP